MRFRSISLAALLLLPCLFARADVVVPGSTAYSEPDPEAIQVSAEQGVTGWTNAKDRVFWVGKFRSTGDLTVALTLKLPQGETNSFRLTAGSVSYEAKAVGKGDAPVTLTFGPYAINSMGYHPITLQGLSKSGKEFAHIQQLQLSGAATQNALFIEPQAQRGAPSVHLHFLLPKGQQVAWFYNQIKVEKSPITSYYEACGWQRGYFGIQNNSPTERRIIFSVWDSGHEPVNRAFVPLNDRVQLVAKGPDVFVGGFGNEGTGLHSHLVYHWHKGQTYRFLVTAQPENDTTVYSGYFYFPDKGRWGLIASFRAPHDGEKMYGLYSFIEDFWSDNGYQRRRAEFGPAWSKTTPDSQWTALPSVEFTDTGDKWRHDFSSGLAGNHFYLATGAFQQGNVKYGDKFTNPAPASPPSDIDLSQVKTQPYAVNITLDTHAAPDLRPWMEAERKICEKWYPIIGRYLATPGFQPPAEVEMRFKKMDGVAYTAGNVITISADYVRQNPGDVGMGVHELTHVVQQYPSYGAGWLVEGIADYVRFFLYEPKVTRPYINLTKATYHDAYRTTAAFLAWSSAKHDKDLVPQISAALREGTYSDALFQKYTGKTPQELWDEFIAAIKAGKAKQFASD